MSFAGKNLFKAVSDNVQIPVNTPTLAYLVPAGTQAKVSLFIYMHTNGSVNGTIVMVVPAGSFPTDTNTFIFQPSMMIGPSRFSARDVPMAAGDAIWFQTGDASSQQVFRVDGVEFT